MSELIKVGDLVVCTKPTPCCGNGARVGYHFVVEHIWRFATHCNYCGKVWDEATQALILGVLGCIQTYRLKRIPPLSELEGEQRKEEITA